MRIHWNLYKLLPYVLPISLLILVIFILARFLLSPVYIPAHFQSFYYLKRTNIRGIVNYVKKGEDRISFFVLTDQIENRKIKTTVKCIWYFPEIELYGGEIVNIVGDIYPTKVFKNPSSFYWKYLTNRQIYLLVTVKELDIVGGYFRGVRKIINEARKYISNTIDKYMSQETSSIVRKMFIDDGEALSRDLKEIYSDAGVVHVLVVSGLHVGYIFALFYFIFRVLMLPRDLRFLLLIPVVVIYTLLTGAKAPATRAATISIVTILSFLLHREKSIYHALMTAALLILSIDPVSFFTPSFQLSFAAYFGIVYLYPKISKFRINNLFLRFLLNIIGISLSAQLFVVPLIAYYFNKVSLISVISNILVVPLAGIILYFAFLFCITAFIFPPFAIIVSTILETLVYVMNELVRIFSGLPYAVLTVATPSLGLILLYFIFLFSVSNYKKISRIVLLFLLSFLTIVGIYHIFKPRYLDIRFIDVGLGDAILVTTPTNEQVLIDTGGSYKYDIGRFVVFPYLKYNGIKKVDKVIITSNNFCHYLGLMNLIENLKIGHVYIPPMKDIDYEWEIIKRKILHKKVSLSTIKTTTEFKFGDVKIRIIPSYPKFDNGAFITKITYNKVSILLTSDVVNIKDVVKDVKNVDVIQYPAHGKHRVDMNAILRLNPKFIIISTNKVSRQVIPDLHYFESSGIKLLSTEKNGLVRILSDGKNIKVRPFL